MVQKQNNSVIHEVIAKLKFIVRSGYWAMADQILAMVDKSQLWSDILSRQMV